MSRSSLAGDISRKKRKLGLGGAVFMGLDAIPGTGVRQYRFRRRVAGAAVVPVIARAALPALCDALSAAQLAAAHPISGKTDEYGYR